MSWIDIVEPEDAEGRLEKIYKSVQTPDGHVDHILKIHSLRPMTLKGHLEIYKAALHSKPNGLSMRERELTAVCVSLLNKCDYCVRHHRAGLARTLGGDAAFVEEITRASVGEIESDKLTERERVLSAYTIKLTMNPQNMVAEDLAPLRAIGLDDATILDLNQVVAYFAYANRTVNGLGVEVAGEALGLHPDEDEEGFAHK
jgi:uncharacterized peroxidase-related enzyme